MKEILKIINEAFGEVSALFMSQEVKGTAMVMPTNELTKIAIRTARNIKEVNDAKR